MHDTRRKQDPTRPRRASLQSRLLAVALLATHLPLLVLLALSLTTDDLTTGPIVAVVLLATLVGAGLVLVNLRVQLRPLALASRRLRRYLHLGVLDLGGPYPDDELGRLLTELDEVCLRLDDARLEAVHAATVDHLTGALTRGATEAKLAELARRVRRRDDHLTIAIVDLDHFKSVNDQLGHAAGDAALQHAVDVLRRSVRGVGLVGRWGGDELILAVQGRSDEVAAGLDRARRAVADRLARVLGRRVTMSAGVAELRPSDTVPECIAIADGALYTAKANGRDRIVDASSGVLQLW